MYSKTCLIKTGTGREVLCRNRQGDGLHSVKQVENGQ